MSSVDPPSALLWTGRVLSGLVVAFLLLDAAMKLAAIAPVIEAQRSLGFAGEAGAGLARGLGLLLLACTLLHALPRTSAVGAMLLTGYLGGAIALQLRAGAPLFSHVLFGAYIGMAMWIGLLLRDPRVWSLLAEGPARRLA